MIENTNFLPDWASPPGETILDFLEDQGLSDCDLARRTESSKEQIQRLLAGEAPLTLELAQKLAEVLGGSTSFWITREDQYRAGLERLTQNEHWVRTLPIRDMVNFGWLPKAHSSKDKVAACLAFFDVPSVADWFETYEGTQRLSAFKTSPSFEADEGATLSWLRKGEVEASTIECEAWNKDRFLFKLASIRKLTRCKRPDVFIPELKQICAECGVALVITQAPSGCRASGATRFLRPDKALIMMSERYRADDHFWFTFFHEAGHLILHSDHDLFLEESEPSSSDEEKEANEFSASILVPREHHYELLKLPINARAVIRFARKIGISPGVVVGQMQHAGVCPHYMLNNLKTRYMKGELVSVASSEE